MSAMFRGPALALPLALALELGACREQQEAAPEAQTAAEQPEAPAGGMPGMPGMQAGGMMGQMQTHMQMMRGLSADSMKAMLPTHRQMVANMISQMNRDMRDMNMAADAQWNATVDSLRQDLTRMPEMGAQELHAFMPPHGARVMRLLEMHRSMMAGMNM
ncbi:MAG: hypothetical protein HY703_02085 [Gemmatimonadetes bacterium]|nr:hypothetical protein [Gemmatimonadota bacterium]